MKSWTVDFGDWLYTDTMGALIQFLSFAKSHQAKPSQTSDSEMCIEYISLSAKHCVSRWMSKWASVWVSVFVRLCIYTYSSTDVKCSQANERTRERWFWREQHYYGEIVIQRYIIVESHN